MAYTGNIPYPWGAGRDVTANSSPLTHHDNLSVLRMLEWLRKRTEEITSESAEGDESVRAELKALIEKIEPARNEEFATAIQALQETVAAVKFAVDRLVAEYSAGGALYDPTSGRRDRGSETVANRLYDYARVHALFAADYDGDEVTAADYDARGWTARRYDLYGADCENPEYGWYGDENHRHLTAPEIREIIKKG